MQRRRPARLSTFDYRGSYRYFVTCCVDARRPVFVDRAAVYAVRTQILQVAQAYAYRDVGSGRLWQDGYYERVLRSERELAPMVAYILANPLRAGLAARVGEYPYAWSIGGDGFTD